MLVVYDLQIRILRKKHTDRYSGFFFGPRFRGCDNAAQMDGARLVINPNTKYKDKIVLLPHSHMQCLTFSHSILLQLTF